ncbi:MAG: hypothetical protein KDE27_13235 [Planctomycetes bacterium]|nr:hypothetical protein [Planctomycetota bacterium]
MTRADRAVRGQHPLEPAELELVDRVLDALAADERAEARAAAGAIEEQLESLALFGQLLGRYPSPLDEQRLGPMRRGLDTLVDSLVATDQASFPFRAPTQALVGRAMNMAQINFLRLLWHVAGSLPDPGEAKELREVAAVRLRAAVHCRLVEEVLADIVTDAEIDRRLREQAVHSLAQLWANRLTWRVHTFFPILAETWEARQRVRVCGGTLGGCTEIFQLLTQGADAEFVELFADRAPGGQEEQAFREFLFGKSSEELDRLAERMAKEGLTSIELDSRLGGDGASGRDAGSILFEFFRTRLVQCSARRIGHLDGPRHTAEGYVMLAWLARR